MVSVFPTTINNSFQNFIENFSELKGFSGFWNLTSLQTTVCLSVFLLACFPTFAEENSKFEFINPQTLKADHEEMIVDGSFKKLEQLMLKGKNVELFINPESVRQRRQSNLCQKITDELLSGSVKNIASLPYESSTKYTNIKKNISGESIFFNDASEQYGGCSENIFDSIRQANFYKNLPKIQEQGFSEDTIDIQNPVSWRLIKLKNTLLLLEVSHASKEENIKFMAALYLHSDDDGFLTGYVNGNKIEKPQCAEDFFNLRPTRDKRSFIVAFPEGESLVAAFFLPEVQANTHLPLWAPEKHHQQLLALHFLDNQDKYLEALRKTDNGLDPLIDSDCLLSITTFNSADGEKQ